MDAASMNPNSMRVWFFWLVLAVALFAFQELLFRLVFPLPEISNFNRINYSMLARDASEGQTPSLSNAAFTWASTPDGAEFVHHLNLYGFRDETWPVKGDKRVMFVGDSFVEGFMAADDETIPRGFELASMADGEAIQTINLGTGASGIVDYLDVIRDAVPIFQPQTVVLVVYANDFGGDRTAVDQLDINTTAIYSNPYVPRLYAVISGLVRGDSVATRWPKKPFQFLPTAESGRSPLQDEAFVERIRQFVSPEILEAMQEGMFNPFVVNEYTNYETFLLRSTDLPGVIEPTKNYIEAHGSKLVVVHIPYKGQVSDQYLEYTKQYDENKAPSSLIDEKYQGHAKSIAAECERLGVPFLDMTNFLRKREADGERMYWNYDEHMKAASYLATGEEIHKFWRSTDSVVTEK